MVRAHRDRRPELERVKHAGKRRVPPDEPSENEPAREPGYGAADRNGVGIRDRRAIERPELRGVAAYGGPTDSKAVVTRGFPRDEERPDRGNPAVTRQEREPSEAAGKAGAIPRV